MLMSEKEMRDFDYIICGNNVGAMVAALTLAQRHKVAVVNPSLRWGGIFAGIEINEAKFDIGMNFLEFDSYHTPCDNLLSYHPDIFNDAARFFHLVRDFMAQRMDFNRVGGIKTYWHGEFYDDFIISNKLEILSALTDEVRQNITAELEEIIQKQPSPLHAANKHKNRRLFSETDYEKVSLANHGQTLHHLLIAPFCQKVLGVSAREVVSLYHRIAWAPLYYPETLLAAIQGEAAELPETPFYFPRTEYFAGVIEALAEEMRENRNIRIIQDAPVGFAGGDSAQLSFAGGHMTAKRLVWCADLEKLCDLADISYPPSPARKSSLTLVFAEVDKDVVERDFSTVFACDAEHCVYRVTNQNATHPQQTRNRFIFEMNTEMLCPNAASSDAAAVAAVQEFSEQANLFNRKIDDDQLTVKHFKNALTLPVTDNLIDHEALSEAVRKSDLTNVDCIGTAANFAAGSFNDQVVMALQLGEKYAAH